MTANKAPPLLEMFTMRETSEEETRKMCKRTTQNNRTSGKLRVKRASAHSTNLCLTHFYAAKAFGGRKNSA